MENKLQCSVSESFQRCGSHHFNLHPSCLSSHSLCFHPQKLSLTHLSLSLSVYLSLNFWPQNPVGSSPTCPLALKNRLSKNITHLPRHTKSTHDVIHQQSVCIMCVSLLISVSTDALQKASQQRPEPTHSTASLAARPRCAEETAPCNTNNPSAAAVLQCRLLILVPPCKVQHCNTHTALGNGCYPPPGIYKAFQSNEIFKSIVSQCIFPKYCSAHLLGADSDDSIKHMNEENCHVDVAEH